MRVPRLCSMALVAIALIAWGSSSPSTPATPAALAAPNIDATIFTQKGGSTLPTLIS